MMRTKLQSAFALLMLLTFVGGLAACSSSSGDGSREPRDVTVVVPPGSSATVPNN